MSSTKPTIILVHGAWHYKECYSDVVPKLEALGFPVVTLDNPSAGDPLAPGLTWQDDMKAIHKIMLPLLDEGKEIFIATHSYGGIPGCASIEGNSIVERAEEGKKGGVKGIIFMSAFAVPARGMTLKQLFGGAYPPWVEVKGDYCIAGPDSIDAFYSDLEPSVAKALMPKIRAQSVGPFETPVTFVASDLKIPSTYLICENDTLLRLEFQKMLVNSIPNIKTVTCAAGHSPFLSQPDVVVEAIAKAAME